MELPPLHRQGESISLLNHASILIAEDEPFIALDLELAIEDAGGDVVGPAASVLEALALLKTRPVAAAILDVNLTDRDISPVVEILIERGIPFILQTGVGLPPELSRFHDLVVCIKPCVAARLAVQLAALISDRPDTKRADTKRSDDDDAPSPQGGAFAP